MAKGVFTTKINPGYDDLPEVRYHFPKTYLNQVRATVGDWIVYYEPRRQDSGPAGRGGRQTYFATARVQRIEVDPRLSSHYYAFVTDFLEFEHPVPFRIGEKYLEGLLMKADGSTNKGAFGRAVRLISEDEYQLMLQIGFTNPNPYQPDSVGARVAEEPEEYKRPTVEQLVSRPFREVAFARSVKAVYNFTCAMTGLKLVNGGGHAEVDAAHIRPVGDNHNGPDSVRNGIALSRSIHWMFDRGLLSLTDTYEILMVKRLVPDPIRRMLNPDTRILLPADPRVCPHTKFLQYHREHIFRG
ncbi:MAG: restriction endonuclease [Deltaproteobacteria bacterium HGW-Deltaproteobacteria-21]|nr:MAG: restriction endonuclease [Deltaproteobacteria bacterium HGW-Deltaproteobacteria-21]